MRRLAAVILMLVLGVGCEQPIAPDDAKAAFDAEMAKAQELMLEKQKLLQEGASQEARDDMERRIAAQAVLLRKAQRAFEKSK